MNGSRAPLALLLGGGLLLGGCIPQVAPPPDYYRPAERQQAAPPPVEEQVSALPASEPAWQAHPVTPNGRFVPASTYIVRPGDTLRRIADRTGAGMLAIARANGLASPYPVTQGQQLTIPGGRYHLIERGDDCWRGGHFGELHQGRKAIDGHGIGECLGIQQRGGGVLI